MTNKKISVLSLFDGMSCGQIALEKANIKYDNYFASEIDKYAIKVTQSNYPNTIQLGDIIQIKGKDLPKIDILMGGSPCQDLSRAKTNGRGLRGNKSGLFWEYARLFKEIKPKYFLLENVRMKWRYQDIISEQLSVEPVMINSNKFVCQNRERYYWTNISIDALPKKLGWKQQYYQWRRTYFRTNKSGACPTLTANMGTGGHNVPLHSKNLKDKLTPLECERLQAIPDDYTKGVSNARRYKMIGDGWTIDVIVHILKNLLGRL